MTSEVKAKVCLTVLIVLMLILFRDVEIGWAQPSAQTLPAANITATSAVLHGMVTTNNKDTLWVFGYVQGYYNPLPPTCRG